MAARLPDPIADRARVSELLAGAEERPGRPLDPDVAEMIYSTVEYLTRTSGVLFATVERITEVTAAAIDRRNARRRTPIGRATRSKVQAVLRVMLAQGWLVHERKTCRARVLVVATPRTEAAKVGAQLTAELLAARADGAGCAGTIEHCASNTDSPIGQSLNTREHNTEQRTRGSADPETEARSTAGRLVDTWRAQLRCRRAPNPAGAWYRCLQRALVDYHHDLPAMAWALNEALAALVAEHGHAALSWDAIAQRLPHTEPGPWTTPEAALGAYARRSKTSAAITTSATTSSTSGSRPERISATTSTATTSTITSRVSGSMPDLFPPF